MSVLLLQSSTGTGVFPSANSNNSVSSYNPVSTNINYPNSTPPAQFTNSNGFNMKNFIKSRTSSIGNSSSQKSKQNNSQLADPKNPVIVHLSMQQNSSSSSSGNGGISSNNDQQIYLNPSDVFTPGDLPDPSRHQVSFRVTIEKMSIFYNKTKIIYFFSCIFFFSDFSRQKKRFFF